MPKILNIVVLAALVLTSVTSFAGSEDTPIGLGIVPPAQFPGENFAVKGIRMSLVLGKNKRIHGIDLGLLGSMTETEFKGIALSGLFNYTGGITTIYGAQLSGITNINDGNATVYGLQASIFANLGKKTDICGAQLGIYNQANHVYGLQIGLVNVASNLHGVQLGLANFNRNGMFGVSPLINVGF